MVGRGFKHKPVGMLIADVKSNCRRLGDIEEATAYSCKAYRSSVNDIAQQYHERIVDSS